MSDYPPIGKEIPPDVKGAVIIGYGTNFLEYKSHEVLIAAAPDDDGHIASIRCRPNGDVLINERLVGNDPGIITGLRAVILHMLDQAKRSEESGA